MPELGWSLPETVLSVFGKPQLHTRRGYVTLAVDPIRTLHLVLAEEVIAIRDEMTRTTHNIGANWAPFPDGALQFIFAYNEALRAVEFGKERNLLASVRWNVSRRSYIDVSHQRTRSEYAFLTTESTLFSFDVRVFF